MFIRPVRKTLVLNTICTVCSTQTVYYISLLCVKYGMHAYAGPACICRMHAPSMLFPPTQFRFFSRPFASVCPFASRRVGVSFHPPLFRSFVRRRGVVIARRVFRSVPFCFPRRADSSVRSVRSIAREDVAGIATGGRRRDASVCLRGAFFLKL